MTSNKKIAANRHNAKFSTGPKSPQGSARTARNALKAGIYARTVLLSSEDHAAYLDLRKAVFQDYMPRGAVEEGLVELIIADLWRLNRLVRIENEFIRHTSSARSHRTKSDSVPKSIDKLLDELL